MDVPGPSSSSGTSSSSNGGIASNDKRWCSFDLVPPPPKPFDQGPADTPPGFSPSPNPSVDNLEEESDGGLPTLSFPAERDEEEVPFGEILKDEESDSPTNATCLLRRISDPEVFLRQNDIYSKREVPAHPLLLSPTAPGSSNKSVTNHVHHPSTADEEDALSNSFHFNFTLSKEEDTVSPLMSDSAAASEEDARISSTPLCSSQIPEHTLSDISGQSSCVEKLVPASFINGDDGDEPHGGILENEEGLRLKEVPSGAGALSLNTTTTTRRKKAVLVEGSTTTSSSSLSDSDDTEEAEGHRELCGTSTSKRRSRNGSLKGEVLPPPPPPLEEVEEAVPMTVDCEEDYWTRLHDITINGCILEYTGIGKSMHDNGFAQSNVPLTPLSHYFEITILDPGENCYIAIGLARKDYSAHKNPGWCRGSIAYHADDGKIFIGGGVGTPFGPRCTTHDVLGCGIIFPVKYAELQEGNHWPWDIKEDDDDDVEDEEEEEEEEDSKIYKSRLPSTSRHRRKARTYSMDNFGDVSSESEDDIWWNNKNQVCEDKVKVFFMRNHKLLGMKEVRIPKGGFYPTIGMMSTNERISVDLHPLSG